MKKTYDQIINEMKQILKEEGFVKFMNMNEETSPLLSKELFEAMTEYVSVHCLKKLHDVEIDNMELFAALESCVPLIKKCREGYLVVVHGHTTGDVIVVMKEEDSPKLVDPTSKEFGDLFPEDATDIYIASCYPGAKPQKWEVQGRTFHNIGDQMIPVTFGINSQKRTFDVGYVSPLHQEFIEKDLEEAALAAAAASK